MSDLSLGQLRQIAIFAEELPVAIWVGSVPSREVVYVNKAFTRVLGMEPSEHAASDLGPYSLHTHDGAPYPEHEMPFERALAARATVEVDDMVIHRHDGGRTYLRVYARPVFDEMGVVSHVLEALTDISREVVSKHEQQAYDAQRMRAQRMESLGSLAGGIAHDFNNLLAAIRIIAGHLAADGSTSHQVRAGLAQIDEVTESAARLTRSLLGFARHGASLSQRLCINEIAARVTELARRTLGRQIVVTSALHEGSLPVQGNSAQLEQLLMNLMVNARDAIVGTGQLTIRSYPLCAGDTQAAEGQSGPYAVLEVEDTGTGIPPSVQERMFEPYFTTKNTGALQGTGLGLATVLDVVENHRGSVVVARTGPTGTVMRVLLPLAELRSSTG